jgi:diacylglycerol kinase (ATP)
VVFGHLAKLGIPAVNLSAESALAARGKSEKAILEQEISGVIAIGGDGTAQLGVNIALPHQIPLGLVPAGSGNDQARELEIPLGNPQAAVDKIPESFEKPGRFDAMQISVGGKNLYSFGSASGGFDALCAKRANGLKWPKGPNSYIAAMLLELPRFRPIQYKLEVDGEHRSIEAMLCGVANVKNFGGGMKISPNSDVQDGYLELFILHKCSRPRLLRIFPSVYEGAHLKFKEVEIIKAKSIRIESAGFPVSSDGEIIGEAPFSVTVLPGALQLWA